MTITEDLMKFTLEYRAALAKNETKAAREIMKRYTAMYARLKPQIEALAQQIAEGEMTAAEVRKLKSLAKLEADMEEELQAFSGYLKTELPPNATRTAGLGAAFAYAVMKYLVGERDIKRGNLDFLKEFFSPGSALYDRLNKLAGYHSQNVIQSILDSVGKGLGPRQVARDIMEAADGAFGGGLVDALRMSRTSELWASRAANLENYRANSDIITGWIWIAELDETTCMSCVALHGQRFDLDEIQDDHHNGRCTSIPEIMGQSPVELQTGEDWFKGQPEETQKDMMGKEFHQAWQGGAFNISDMTRQNPDDVYGTMRTSPPLYDLLGAEPPTGAE